MFSLAWAFIPGIVETTDFFWMGEMDDGSGSSPWKSYQYLLS
jgi:hypothetical protein